MFSAYLIALFLVVMISIGIWGMRKTRTLDDFFLGGRTVGPWVSAFAYGTSYFSAVLFIGFAGKLGWGLGLNALWIAAGNALIGSLAAWLVLGRRTRRMTNQLNVMTMPEFFEERYQAPALKLLAAMIVFVFLLPYSASVYKGLGHLFEINFDVSYDTALLAMTVITGAYLILGGYFAVTLTDFIQGLIMIGGSLAMVFILTDRGGGLATVIANIREAYPLHVPPSAQPPWYFIASLVFMTSFGTWGLPQMIQKFYAIRDERQIGRAAVVTTVFAAIIGFAAYFLGAMTHAFYDALPESSNPFDRLIPDLLNTYLPEPLMALIVLLVLSASMSTLSSLILVASSSIAIDLYRGRVNPAVSTERSLVLMRFLSGVFIAVSFLIARFEFAVIVTLMSLSWGAVAGAFLAPYVYGLYWKRTTRAGATAGMVAGLGTACTLFFVLGRSNAPIAASIAMLVPFVVVPAVSLVTRPPDPAVLETAFGQK